MTTRTLKDSPTRTLYRSPAAVKLLRGRGRALPWILAMAAFPLTGAACSSASRGGQAAPSSFGGDAPAGGGTVSPPTTLPPSPSTSFGGADDEQGGTDVEVKDPNGGVCAARGVAAKQKPLDLVFMVDISGSMLEKTDSGATKWDEVKAALKGFTNNPRSAGLGVSMSYFPANKPNVPRVCTTNAQCTSGGAGNCTLRACTNASRMIYCDSTSECPSGGSCQPLGICSNRSVYCFVGSNSCGSGATCEPQDPAAMQCSEATSCNVAQYQTASVTRAELPGAAAAVAASLDAQVVIGGTPTRPAIEGALAQARAIAPSDSGHTVATVLVTDGLPTQCGSIADGNTNFSQRIDEIVPTLRSATTAERPVKTYVIGVFAPSEATEAATNLNRLAAAGGTESALVIRTNQNVSDQLVRGLNAIRNQLLSCEYDLPKADDRITDFDKVNVNLTRGDGTATTLGYKSALAACDTGGGWYYNSDPRTGADPTKVIACPATCDVLKEDPRAKIEINVGCKTVIR